MKKAFNLSMVFLAILLAIAFCNSQIEEAERAHAQFVATVDYLQPQAIEQTFSGKTVLENATSNRYGDDHTVEWGKPEKANNWSYDIQLTPVSREEAINGYCQPYSDRPGCVWSYYVMTIIAEKDGQKYVTAFSWQAGTGYDPEARFNQQSFTIVRNQYFVVSYNDVSLNPEFKDTIVDLDSITGPWISAVGEREGIPQLP